MWAALLAGFGVILNLGASGADANIICDTKPALAVTTTSTAGGLQDATKDCIELFCTTRLKAGETGGFFTDRCGQVVLTITHVDDASAQSDIEGCVTHFGDLVDQCIATKSVRGGTLLIGEVLYEAYVVNEEEKGIQGKGILSEENEKPTLRVRHVEEVQLQVRKSKAKNKPDLAAKPKPATKPKPAPKPKSTPKASPTPKLKPSKPQQDCDGKKNNNSNNNKNGKKTIRDVLDGFLPHILHRTPPPQDEASCALPATVHYQRKVLETGKVWQYTFDSSAGWEKAIKEEKVRSVLTKMNQDGKLTVVTMKGAQSYCVGDPEGRTSPYNLAVQSM